ncbi:hypothetical protein V6N12_072124 [Hibiscus sabdariffa]|uniref:Uncharacterized protein n=1 Tax=Hibiscus sabdariffa TaxID=183260 RepID=A0ABR2FLT2_9ROSI
MPVTQILLFMRRLVHVKISINWLKSSKRIAANEAPSFEHSVLIIAPKEGTIPSVWPYKWLANFHLDMMAGAVMGGVASNPREQFGVRGWSEKEIGNGSSVLRYFPSVALDFSLKMVDAIEDFSSGSWPMKRALTSKFIAKYQAIGYS